MLISNEKQLMRLAWLWIGIFAIGRLFYAQAFLLSPDETNYWQWARHLDWGYHDQAPLIAWAIRLTTMICGHTELGVRLPSILAITTASLYLVLIARRWFNPRIAFHTALLSQAIFLFNVGGVLATADGLQGAAWAAASYHTARAFDSHRWRQWLAGGLWFGVGLLSKYTMVLFLPCILAYAVSSSTHRKYLLSAKPYIGCVMGTCMLLPVILWNAANDWNSVRHVAHLGGADQSFAVHFNFLADYLAAQAGLLTPLVFILICTSWYMVARRNYPSEQWIYPFLFFTSFPVIAGFALLSLHTRVYGNWPGAGYLTAVVLAAAMWSLKPQKDAEKVSTHASPITAPIRKIWFWTLGSSYLLTTVVLLHAVHPILPLPLNLDRSASELHGWKQLGQQVAKIKGSMPQSENVFIFGLQYQIASELAFYTPGQPQTVSINRWNRPNVYDYWWQDADLIGKDAVGVIHDGGSRSRLLEVFERVETPAVFKAYRSSVRGEKTIPTTPLKTLYIYRCYGFKGGLRWLPSDRGDIRVDGN